MANDSTLVIPIAELLLRIYNNNNKNHPNKSKIKLQSSFITYGGVIRFSHNSEKCDTTFLFKKVICPITHEYIMLPVKDKYGHHYEYTSIKEWLKKKSISPLTKEPLTLNDLTADLALKERLDNEFQANSFILQCYKYFKKNKILKLTEVMIFNDDEWIKELNRCKDMRKISEFPEWFVESTYAPKFKCQISQKPIRFIVKEKGNEKCSCYYEKENIKKWFLDYPSAPPPGWVGELDVNRIVEDEIDQNIIDERLKIATKRINCFLDEIDERNKKNN